MSLNSVNIMGNLTRDPELRYTPSGAGVCSLSVANNRVYTKNGEKVSEVSYFDVDVWGVQGENCSKYLAKGRGVVIEGRLRQDRWEKEGKTQSKVRIVANSVHFLPRSEKSGSYNENQGGGVNRINQADAQPAAPQAAATPSPDDIAWEE